MRLLIVISALLHLVNSFASDTHEHEHKHKAGHKEEHKDGHKHNLKAHQHGHIKLLMSVEKNVVDILIEGPTESFLAFEHRPKTDKQKKRYDDFYKSWMTSNESIFKFPSKAKCLARSPKIEWKSTKESNHSELALSVKYYCSPPIEANKVKINFDKKFERVSEIEIDVLPLKKMPYSKNIKSPKSFQLEL